MNNPPKINERNVMLGDDGVGEALAPLGQERLRFLQDLRNRS